MMCKFSASIAAQKLIFNFLTPPFDFDIIHPATGANTNSKKKKNPAVS